MIVAKKILKSIIITTVFAFSHLVYPIDMDSALESTLASISSTVKSAVTSARKAYQQKNYSEAITILKEAEPQDTTASTDLLILYIYTTIPSSSNSQTLNEEIYWSKRALTKIKEGVIRKTLFSEIGYDYEKLHQFVLAFKYNNIAARMGDATAQQALVRAYAYGNGTMTNYTKAYAWLIAATANGVPGIDSSDLYKVKIFLATSIIANNESLQDAKILGREYFKLYVLNKTVA